MIILGNQPAMAREPHRSLFYLYLKQVGLDNLWHRILRENRGGKLSYHNNEHLFGVAHLCRDIGLAEGLDSAELKVVVAAGLIHDVNHAGSGKAQDADNIQRARNWFDLFIQSLKNGSQEKNFYITFGKRISETVVCTEFPFKIEPSNKFERILRDADILWSYQREGARIVNDSLYKEVDAGKLGGVKMQDFIDYNINFYKTTTWYTTSARLVADQLRDHLIKMIQ